MAVYKLFPTSDASIYSAYPAMNTGVDSILEISNTVPDISPSPRVSRALIKFDQDEIDDVINNKISGADWDSFLRLFIAEAEGINFNTYLEVVPITGSWNNGSGQYLDSPETQNGVSWKYSDFSGSNLWDVDTTRVYVTSSYYNSSNKGGGTWYTGSAYISGSLIVSQSFDIRSDKDLEVNVKNPVLAWYTASNSLPTLPIYNEGFIIKLPNDVEFVNSQSLQPIFKYYSVDTNTIYPPCLEFRWDDFSYETGSLSTITTENIFIGLDNNVGTYKTESINKFRLNIRPEFPSRTYLTSSLYTTNQVLPTSSYYAIKDLDTNEFVVNFDTNYTKISCDENGNYFTIYMNGLEPERYYKILIKTIINGNTIIKDNDYYFKVING